MPLLIPLAVGNISGWLVRTRYACEGPKGPLAGRNYACGRRTGLNGRKEDFRLRYDGEKPQDFVVMGHLTVVRQRRQMWFDF